MSYPDKVMELVAEGPVSSADAAAELGVSQRIASAVLCRMYRERQINRSRTTVRTGSARGLYFYYRRTARAWTTAEIEKLRSMSGHSAAEISRVLGRSEAAVYQCAAREGVSLLGYRFNRWPKDTRDNAVNRCMDGVDANRVAAEMGIPKSTVSQWARRA